MFLVQEEAAVAFNILESLIGISVFFFLHSCSGITGVFLCWKVDELEKTILVASRDPAYYGLDEVELSRRRNWIGSARNQVFLDVSSCFAFYVI